MQDDPYFQRNQAISYVDSSHQQDAEAIEQLRLGWQQFRATQQQTIIIEFVPSSPIVDESQCVEGSISEVSDAK